MLEQSFRRTVTRSYTMRNNQYKPFCEYRLASAFFAFPTIDCAYTVRNHLYSS